VIWFALLVVFLMLLSGLAMIERELRRDLQEASRQIHVLSGRVGRLESGLACGPEAQQFDGLASVEARLNEAIEGAGSVAEEIHQLGGRVTELEETTDAYATKSRVDALLDAVAHLCERAAKLDRGLQSLADDHAEESAATSKALAGVKDRLFTLDSRVASLRSFREALHRASDPAALHPEDDPE
jgi:chromosome segregation ATPase